MDKFLHGARKHLGELDKASKVIVVLGNEACDLDSAVSSLVLALQLDNSVKKDGEVVLPVLNIPQCDLPLKTEVMFYFEENDVPTDLLIFRDEVDLHSLHKARKLKLVLVDHHVLPAQDQILKSSVVQVFDHRPREPGTRWDGCDVRIQEVGSCCTLVAERMLGTKPELLTEQVATLLYGPILLDTACLSEKAGRATQLDHKIAKELEKHMSSPSPQEVFRLLKAARSNMSGLTPQQLLTKDLKVVAGIPMASMPMLVKEFLALSDALGAVKRFCSDNSYSAIILMGLRMDEVSDDIRRELAVYASNETIREKLVAQLQECEDPKLLLKRIDAENVFGPELMLFQQENMKASRKQVLPIVKAFASSNPLLQKAATKDTSVMKSEYGYEGKGTTRKVINGMKQPFSSYMSNPYLQADEAAVDSSGSDCEENQVIRTVPVEHLLKELAPNAESELLIRQLLQKHSNRKYYEDENDYDNSEKEYNRKQVSSNQGNRHNG